MFSHPVIVHWEVLFDPKLSCLGLQGGAITSRDEEALEPTQGHSEHLVHMSGVGVVETSSVCYSKETDIISSHCFLPRKSSETTVCNSTYLLPTCNLAQPQILMFNKIYRSPMIISWPILPIPSRARCTLRPHAPKVAPALGKVHRALHGRCLAQEGRCR